MIISAERAQRSQVVLSGGHITIEPRSHARFKPVSQWARSVAYFGVFALAVSENSLKSSDFESLYSKLGGLKATCRLGIRIFSLAGRTRSGL